MDYGVLKVCSECGKEKPESKFYKHPAAADGLMPHCKACHNGCEESAKIRRVESLDRQWGDPSEETIRFECLKIQAGWTPEEERRRRERPFFARKAGII